MNKKFSITIISLLFATMGAHSQVTIGSNEKPSSAALLDLKTTTNTTGGATTTTGGLLLPRVELTSLTSLAPFISGGGSSADKTTNKGLVVYNLTNNTIFKPGLYTWDGAQWVTYSQSSGVGALTANNGLTLSGTNIQLGGTLTTPTTVTGSTTNTLTLNAPTTVGANLTVTGTTALKNTGVTGNLTVTGNETVGGTLGVTGATTLTGNLTSNGTTTTKATNVTGAMKYTNTTPTVGQYLSASNADGTVAWTTLPATATNAEPWKKQTDGSDATLVTDNAYMTGNLAVGSNSSGAYKLQVTGNTNTIGTATTTGNAVVTGDTKTGTSTVTGNETVGGTLAVTGTTTLTGNLTSNGTTTTKATNVTGAMKYTNTTPTVGQYLSASNADGTVAWTTLPATATSEPWRVQGGTNMATANTDNIYQMGNVNIGAGTTASTYKLNVAGTANVTGATTLGSTLGVTGATTLTGDLTSNGTTALKNTNVTGDLTVTNGTVSITPPSSTTHTGLYLPKGASSGKVLTSDTSGNASWVSGAVQYQTLIYSSGKKKVYNFTPDIADLKIDILNVPYIDKAKEIYGSSYGWDNSNFQYVAPVNGVYRIAMNVYFNSTTSGVNHRVYVYKNGTLFQACGFISVTDTGNDQMSYVMSLTSLVKGDIIEFRVVNTVRRTFSTGLYGDSGHTFILIESL